MNTQLKDIFTGLIFFTGIAGFIAGEYIISSALLAVTTLVSNVNANSKKNLN
ncbi:MAG: hypothetical protein PHW13_00740 [Methylococcales bacterium]|nr:hypothetical protein [Methylococcales bacterium]